MVRIAGSDIEDSSTVRIVVINRKPNNIRHENMAAQGFTAQRKNGYAVRL
jgi:hypothetical protein